MLIRPSRKATPCDPGLKGPQGSNIEFKSLGRKTTGKKLQWSHITTYTGAGFSLRWEKKKTFEEKVLLITVPPPPHSTGNKFQDFQMMPEILHITEPYVYFSL